MESPDPERPRKAGISICYISKPGEMFIFYISSIYLVLPATPLRPPSSGVQVLALL